ncbi:aspartate carbamoyltransferase [Candidatus Kaiserbacteria bacterium]|nr:aspartate carbamoyltransferase [Candidatus Kaiserbacteria bacterium]
MTIKLIPHVLRAQDFGRARLDTLFDAAAMIEQKGSDSARGKTLMFYSTQPTTRTRVSFCVGMEKLGGTAHAISSSDSSQELKHETIEDTVVSLAKIGADVIVLRHNDEDAIFSVALVSPVPVINGGSGKEQHPTQALTDIYTIHRSHKDIDGLSIALVGDLKFGRTTNSLAYLLTKYQDVKLYLVSPAHLRMKGDLRYYLHEHGMHVEETTDFERVIGKVDVVYQTRAQKEYTTDANAHDGLAPYVIDRKMVERMKKNTIILHPLPRNQELSREVDVLPQQKYLDQMYYGRLIRMALLQEILR